MSNLILNTDSYKSSHWLQYPLTSEYVSSYIEARTGGHEFPQMVFFGLQAFLKQYLGKPITAWDIDEAREIFSSHGEPFNGAGWRAVLNKHKGFLPLEIQAIPEGSVVPRGTALVQVVNTDPELPWLTSYIETALLRAVWYPSTVATVSWTAKQTIMKYLEATCDDPQGQIDFKLHDFGARGVSSQESAGLGGLAHLTNFKGSDTLAALIAGRRYYSHSMAGYSIPAAEHSTITSWGRDNEAKAYENMLDQFGAGQMLAVVSDSYSLQNAVDNIWGKQLKQKVLDMNATLVVRPDSGIPEDVVLDTIQSLMQSFGYSTNSKGYAVLHPKVRVIQGDGVNLINIGTILETLKSNKISAENVTFGMGGGLLQKIDRDTLRFAMKASAIMVKGMWRDVFKDPITDPGKKSKAGRLGVSCTDGIWKTDRFENIGYEENLLKPIWKNGDLLQDYSLEEVRQRIKMEGEVK